ncbi:DUF4253 domain-containing protein [Catellatospora methionotrophica]|uniref:DUF4253 domain-containing protein n=1 Tax=Catellatospora methionotrophica TaxID=121620 RepID=UPI0033E145EC
MESSQQDALAGLLRPGRSLDVKLPPGEQFVPHGWTKPAFWVSDEPVTPHQWTACRTAHPRSGLWPVLMYDLPCAVIDDEADPDRWQAMRRIDEIDVEALMASAACWDGTGWDGTDFRQSWQGLASPGVPQEPADARADRSIVDWPSQEPCRLMLVPADRSADVVASIAWRLFNQDLVDPIESSAILRSWEDRFGARVTHLGDGVLTLSVAAPPADRSAALRVVAEHLVFCADSLSNDPDDFSAHLDHLISGDPWSFWWD